MLYVLVNDNAEIRELVDLVASDPAFSAQILRLANSVEYGHRARIDSLQHALVTLGLLRVQTLAMTIATSNYVISTIRVEEVRRCWRHSLAAAVLSQELAHACSMPEDRAYSVGLLHDIGRLGLLVTYPDEFASALKDADREPQALLDLEARLFGLDHCELGRKLAEHWNLPPEFQLVAGRHHDAFQGGSVDLLAIGAVACRLADALGYCVVAPLKAPVLEELLDPLPLRVRQSFVSEPDRLRELIAKRIDAHDTARGERVSPAVPAADEEPPESPEEEEEEEKEEDAGVPEPAADDQPARFHSIGPDSIVRDLAVIGISGTIFTLVLLVCAWLWMR
jgi:putative nucleotidyltransferase with HDIG domain